MSNPGIADVMSMSRGSVGLCPGWPGFQLTDALIPRKEKLSKEMDVDGLIGARDTHISFLSVILFPCPTSQTPVFQFKVLTTLKIPQLVFRSQSLYLLSSSTSLFHLGPHYYPAFLGRKRRGGCSEDFSRFQ